MSTGLRLFEKFDSCYLEVCVPDKDKQRFEHEYMERTGEVLSRTQDGYNNRHRTTPYNAWGIEYRVYFKTSDNWVIDSLKKLGYHTEVSDKLIAVEFIKDYPEHGYQNRVTNMDLFWRLLEYGYKLGENKSIPFDLYLLRQLLLTMCDRIIPIVPGMEIRQIESENPVFEAMLLAGMQIPTAA